MTSVVLRITRHSADEDRLAAFRAAYGSDVVIADEDMRYGDNPVAAVLEAIARHSTDYHRVVAVEAIGPFTVVEQLVRERQQLNVDLLRAEFARGENGRAVVVGKDAQGRDILQFSHYVRLLRLEFQTEPIA